MTRFLRRIAALVALAALTFGQLAVSAHACPQATPESVVAVQAPQDGDCCDKVKPNVNVCERHCDYGASSVDSHGASPVAVSAAVPEWRVEPAAIRSIPSRAVARTLERRVEPPPLQLFGVLRI